MNLDLKTYNKRIGYIVGAGDKVPEALEQMGYEVTFLLTKNFQEIIFSNLMLLSAV